MYTHNGESSESLEGDRGRDRVRRCRLLTSFQEGLEGDRGRVESNDAAFLTSLQEGPHQKLFFQGILNSASKKANCIIVDIVNSLCYY